VSDTVVASPDLVEEMNLWPSPQVTGQPFDLYSQLRKQAPVYKHPTRNEYFVSRYEDLTAIAQQPEIFSSDLFGGVAQNGEVEETRMKRILWTKPADVDQDEEKRRTPYPSAASDPPEHRLKRRLGLMMVTRQKLQSYEPMIQRHVDELIDAFIERGSFEFREEFGNVLPVRVILDVLGLPLEDEKRLRDWGDTEAGGSARYVSEERSLADERRTKQLAAYVRAALVERHAAIERDEEPAPGFFSEIIRAQIAADGEFDLDFLNAECGLLVRAGNNTTSHMLASAMMLLCQNPENIERLRTEPELIPQFIDETMRVQSPIQWTQRQTKVDAVVNGVQIPARSWVIMMWASANRDPERFADPAEMKIDREDVGKLQLGFGHGIHRCVGAPLAQLEGRIVFETILRRITNFRIADGADLRNADSVRFRVPRELPITFDAL